MTVIKLSFLFIAYSFILGPNSYAHDRIEKDNASHVNTQNLLRFIDSKEEHGRSCEEYSYISSWQRLQLLTENTFMLGDILSDTLVIADIHPDDLVETDLTECNVKEMDVSEYTYKEQLAYINENIISIDILQYIYGAGAAHGDEHISHYMYDRKYGMKLDWENLFGQSEAFDRYVFKRVIKEIADEDFITYFKTSDQIFNYRISGYFAITDKGLLIQYGKYEITPGSSGLPSIIIPKEVLKQYMSQEIYEKCFLPDHNIAYVLNAI